MWESIFGNNFIPHGVCLRWDPALVCALIVGNIGIAFAYFSIPASLWYFVRKRKSDLPYPWLFTLFGSFILACGLTHIVHVLTLYRPYYWLEALVDLFTAAISLVTAFLLWPILPEALALRSPKVLEKANKQLEETNQKLEIENAERLKAEISLQERTIELQQVNDQLLEAKDQAVEASSLKSVFVANISHELRTPLTGVLGLNEILMGLDLKPEQAELAGMIQKSAKRLLNVVNDILDVSKIEAGKLNIERAELSIKNLINDVVDLLKKSANDKNLKLEIELDDGIPDKAFGDPARLNQVLVNLTANAIKFTDRGAITIRARVSDRDAQSIKMTFSVIDTGIGISEENRHLLFIPFTQVDGSTTRRHGGTGLGLTISRRLVELMGGVLDFDSRPGKGSTFWFSIPLELEATGSFAVSDAESNEQKLLVQQDAKILVVEDNPILHSLVLKQLQVLGLTAAGVFDGETALAHFNLHKYSLILMDCHLPGIDGFEVTKRIRMVESERNEQESVVIIAMTASAMREDNEKCIEAGMDDYLSKPYTIEQLREILSRQLSAVKATSQK